MANPATIRIATNVLQLSVQGLYSDTKPVANVQYWQANQGVDGDDCATFVRQAFDKWQDGITPLLADVYKIVSGQWMLMTSADSPTGTVAPTVGKPLTGVRTGIPTQSNTAFLVHKTLTSAGRSARNGRLFLAGALETDVAELGEIASPQMTNGQAQLNTYYGMVASITVDNVAWTYVQPHWSKTNRPAPEVGGLWPATSVGAISGLRLDPRAATQRQRMR